MSMHKDLLNRRKCLHIYLNGTQSPDNICDYRYGSILNTEKCITEDNNPVIYENDTQSISELRMNFKENTVLNRNILESIDETSNELDFDFNPVYEIYNPNSKNQHKDLTSYGDDNTKERYTEGNEFWKNPNEKNTENEKTDNSNNFTKSAYKRGKDFWNNLNRKIEFK